MILDNFEINNKINIKSVNYQEANMDIAPEKLMCSDTIEYSYDGKGIKIQIKRSVFFEPTAVFDIVITAETYLKEKNSSKYDKKELEFDDFYKEFEPIITAICSRISTVISVITMASNLTPLITPPQLTQDSQDK